MRTAQRVLICVVCVLFVTYNLSHWVVPKKDLIQKSSSSEEHHSFSLLAEKEGFIFLVFFIVGWTIAFEFLEHQLKHKVPEHFQPVLDQGFSELTVLGFIGVIALLVTEPYYFLGNGEEAKSVMQLISETLFHESEHLIHRFHQVHYQIFFLMMSFITMVCTLLGVSALFSKKYSSFERSVRDMHKQEQGQGQEWRLHPAKLETLQYLFFNKNSLSEHQVFRDRLVAITPAIGLKKVTKKDAHVVCFDYADYRAEKDVQVIVKLLKLSIADWAVVVAVILFFVAVYDDHNQALIAVSWLMFAVINFTIVFFWVYCCEKAKAELLPVPKDALTPFEVGKSYNNKSIKVSSDFPLITQEGSSSSIPKYLDRKIILREKPVEKFIFKVPATRQEQLFWGQNIQSTIMVGLLRCSSFFVVIQVAGTVSLGDFFFAKTEYIPIGIICVIFYVLTTYLIVKGIQVYSLCTSVEQMKDVTLAEKVCDSRKLKNSHTVWQAMSAVERLLDKSEKKSAVSLTQEDKPAFKIKTPFQFFNKKENEASNEKYVELQEDPITKSKKLPKVEEKVEQNKNFQVVTQTHSSSSSSTTTGTHGTHGHNQHHNVPSIGRTDFENDLKEVMGIYFKYGAVDYGTALSLMKETWPALTDVNINDLSSYIKLMDLDKSTTIDQEEFLAVTLQQIQNFDVHQNKSVKLRGIIDKLFQEFDTDNSESLNLLELEEAFKKAGVRNSQFNFAHIFEEMDTSGDGNVTKTEFEEYVAPAILSESGSSHSHAH